MLLITKGVIRMIATFATLLGLLPTTEMKLVSPILPPNTHTKVIFFSKVIIKASRKFSIYIPHVLLLF